jgi:hypothetical protein
MLLFGSKLVSSPENIYMITLAIMFMIYLSCRIFVFLRYILLSCPIASDIRPFLLNHVVYARSYGRFLGLRSVSRFHLLLTSLYIISTAVCNVIYVESIATASRRAARLCLINLTPTFLANLEFGARVFGISLQTYSFIHRSFAIVSFFEAIVHVTIMICTKSISLSDTFQFYGVLVCIRPLSLCISFC